MMLGLNIKPSRTIPRPFRDVAMGLSNITSIISAHASQRDGLDEARKVLFKGSTGGTLTLPPAKKMIAGSLRLTLLALGIFAINYIGWQKGPLLVVGSIVSLPTVAISVGGEMLFGGMRLIGSNLTRRALISLAKGFALLASGYFVLEHHDFVHPFGIVDKAIDKAAEKYAPAVARWVTPTNDCYP